MHEEAGVLFSMPILRVFHIVLTRLIPTGSDITVAYRCHSQCSLLELCHDFSRLEVRDQGASEVGFWWGPSSGGLAYDLITSQSPIPSPHLLIPAHWGSGFSMWIGWGASKTFCPFQTVMKYYCLQVQAFIDYGISSPLCLVLILINTR